MRAMQQPIRSGLALARLLLLLWGFVLVSQCAVAQSAVPAAAADPAAPPDSVQQRLTRAMQAIGQGEFEAARPILLRLAEGPRQLSPEEQYQVALGFQLIEEPLAALQLVYPLLERPATQPEYYVLAGNALTTLQQPDSAYRFYRRGLEQFPGAGELYLQLGLYHQRRLEQKQALQYWENGILYDPAFPTNYYHACKFYSRTPERLWAITYGELYMNLTPVTQRSEEISRLLWASYQDAITFTSDSTFTIQLTTQNSFQFDSLGNVVHPYPLAMQSNHAAAVSRHLLPRRHPERPITVRQLMTVREQVLDFWLAQERDTSAANPLIHRWLQLRRARLWEPYHYWLFRQGAPRQYSTYRFDFRELLADFRRWKTQQFFVIPENSILCRLYYMQ